MLLTQDRLNDWQRLFVVFQRLRVVAHGLVNARQVVVGRRRVCVIFPALDFFDRQCFFVMLHRVIVPGELPAGVAQIMEDMGKPQRVPAPAYGVRHCLRQLQAAGELGVDRVPGEVAVVIILDELEEGPCDPPRDSVHLDNFLYQRMGAVKSLIPAEPAVVCQPIQNPFIQPEPILCLLLAQSRTGRQEGKDAQGSLFSSRALLDVKEDFQMRLDGGRPVVVRHADFLLLRRKALLQPCVVRAQIHLPLRALGEQLDGQGVAHRQLDQLFHRRALPALRIVRVVEIEQLHAILRGEEADLLFLEGRKLIQPRGHEHGDVLPAGQAQKVFVRLRVLSFAVVGVVDDEQLFPAVAQNRLDPAPAFLRVTDFVFQQDHGAQTVFQAAAIADPGDLVIFRLHGMEHQPGQGGLADAAEAVHEQDALPGPELGDDILQLLITADDIAAVRRPRRLGQIVPPDVRFAEILVHQPGQGLLFVDPGVQYIAHQILIVQNVAFLIKSQTVGDAERSVCLGRFRDRHKVIMVVLKARF